MALTASAWAQLPVLSSDLRILTTNTTTTSSSSNAIRIAKYTTANASITAVTTKNSSEDLKEGEEETETGFPLVVLAASTPVEQAALLSPELLIQLREQLTLVTDTIVASSRSDIALL
jgi:hypothetical protein